MRRGTALERAAPCSCPEPGPRPNSWCRQLQRGSRPSWAVPPEPLGALGRRSDACVLKKDLMSFPDDVRLPQALAPPQISCPADNIIIVILLNSCVRIGMNTTLYGRQRRRILVDADSVFPEGKKSRIQALLPAPRSSRSSMTASRPSS